MRKRHNFAFHLVMLLFILVATILVFYKALVHLRHQIDDIKINSVYRVRQIGEDYELLLQSNEEIISRHLLDIYPELSSKYLKSSEQQYNNLSEESHALGFDLLMVMDIEGNILASTNIKLKGEKLSTVIPEYQKAVEKAQTARNVFIDRVGLLAEPQVLYKPCWAVSENGERILLYAIDFDKYLKDNNSESFAAYLMGGYFDNLANSVMLVSDIDICFHQNSYYYSYSGLNDYSESIQQKQMYNSIESQIINNYDSVILPLRMWDSSEINDVHLRVTFDNDMVRQISLNLLFRAILGFVILSMVIYLIVYFFFKSIQHDREEVIVNIIKSIRAGEFDSTKLEKDTFKKEIESGIIELAEHYQEIESQNEEKLASHEELKSKLETEKKEAVEILHRQLENSHAQVKSLISELEEAREQSDRFRRNDVVTGLPNRDVMLEHIDYEISRSGREKKEFCLLILKIGNLKDLSGEYGHNFGDYILNKTGAKLRALLRKQDRIGKWQMDEFMLVLPGTGSIGIRQLIAKIQEMIEQIDFVHEGKSVKIETLYGGAVYKPGMQAGSFVRQAVLAVQEAEHSTNPTIFEK